MSIYQGDTYTFSLSLTHADGSLPSVSVPPVIQIVFLADGSSVLGSPAAMAAVAGTSNQLWTYTWTIGSVQSGQYMAIVSYAADTYTFNSVPLEKISVGDSRVIGVVALDSTVAKDATVALDATVAHMTDLVPLVPDTSPAVIAIKAKTDGLPSDPAGMTLLATTIQDVADIHDAQLGEQIVDKTQNPAVYTIKRLDTTVLATYNLIDNSTESFRQKTL